MKIIGIEEHIRLNEIGDADHIKSRLRDMDGAGIDMQVLSTPFVQMGQSNANEASVSTNNAMSKLVEKYHERFAGFAAVAIQEPEAAAKELERAITQLGLKGALIFSQGYFDDQKYYPFFAEAEKLDVPIYFHGGSFPTEIMQPYSVYPGLSGAMHGMGAHTSLMAMRLILGRVFEKYPRLKIILGHLGEGLPFWLWRIDSRWLEEQDRNPESKKFYANFPKHPSQYFRDNFYVTTSGQFWHPALIFVNSVLGSDRILFAADYPPESINEAGQFIRSAPISDGDKEKICHLNAEKLLGL